MKQKGQHRESFYCDISPRRGNTAEPSPFAWSKNERNTWTLHHLPSEQSFVLLFTCLFAALNMYEVWTGALSSGVEEWLRFRKCKQHFKGKKFAVMNNITQAGYSTYWLRTHEYVCRETHAHTHKHTAVLRPVPPVVGQQSNCSPGDIRHVF